MDSKEKDIKNILNEIVDLIYAEIPITDVNDDLHEVVTKDIIHGPCGTLNPNSPCIRRNML